MKTKRTFYTFVFFLLSVFAYAQNLSVTDFRLDEMDLTANQQGTIVLDQNGEKCALIRVKTTQTGFSFDVGSLGVSKTLQKTAEIWVYVPHGVRKMSVSHQKYGSLEYPLPVTTERAKTYIMELKADTPLPVNSQKLTVKCEPKNTVVMIDGEMVELSNGQAETVLALGSHKYVAMANGYYQTEGAIELKADRPGKLTIELDAKEPVASSSNTVSASTSPSQSTPSSNISEEPVSFTVKGVTFNMIPVEGGTFTMGATPEMEKQDGYKKSTSPVTLSSYMIGETEVTQELWKAVMGKYPKNSFMGKKYPIHCVSWDDCQKFINTLNYLTGMHPTGRHFRLPTEAEWEFAARGGNKSRHTKYSGSDNIDEVGWCKENSRNGYMHPVKTKKPNELGIYDMTGNVLEWCQAVFVDNSNTSQTNPTGPESGSKHVQRGGCSGIEAKYCTPLISYTSSDGNNLLIGLRLCLSE